MNTLFIDTHSNNVLVILFKDGKIIAKENVLSSNKHSEITMPIIEKIINSNLQSVNDLSEIIVVNGPGSFTGVRLAVTIAKTMAYTLNIPIKTIDSLIVKAIMLNGDRKVVSLEDRNGAFIGVFDSNNNIVDKYKYLNKNDYFTFKSNNNVVSDIDIDYEKVYDYLRDSSSINPHSVKPLYIKGISALDDKRS